MIPSQVSQRIKKQIAWAISIVCAVLVIALPAHATDYTSSSFILRDPVVSVGGGRATSSHFQLISNLGGTVLGESTSTSNTFTHRAGFLYFPLVNPNAVVATVGDAQVGLSWTVPRTFLGIVVGGYEVGTGTVSGSYTFQNVGNVTSFTKTGLTNGTVYYFKIKAKAADGSFLVFSNEISNIPVRVTTTQVINSINPTQAVTGSLQSTEGTTAVVNISANTLVNDDTYKLSLYSFPNTEASTALPVPSDKIAATTMYNFSINKSTDLTQVTSFTQPVTVTVSYTDASIAGLAESSLVLYRWDGSQWSALTNQTLDATHNTISGSTTHFSNFAILGTASSNSNSGSSGGGGGGGSSSGGSYSSPPSSTGTTTVILKGLAYPSSTVTVLKDGAVVANTTADPGAQFSVSITGLGTGIYSFSLYALDINGNKSPTLSFFQSLTNGSSTTVDNLFLGPSIGVSHTEIKQGDTITIFGYTAPQSDVSVFVNSPQAFVEKITANAIGAWVKAFNTSVLEVGGHHTKSQSAKVNLLSEYSQTVAFTVGSASIKAAPKSGTCQIADMNCNGRVGLTDLSIILYNYNKPTLTNLRADLNKDGVVNLTDFSILLYYWTGG